MRFDPTLLVTHAPAFLAGAWVTLQVTVLAFLLGYAIGLGMALVALLPGALPRGLVAAYVATLRSIPFIITLFVVYYGLAFVDLRLPPAVTGTVALAVFAGAYYTEVIRAGILAIPRGQFDSGHAIGMTGPQVMRNIVFPQVVRGLVPPSTNTTLSMMKESAVLSSITVAELTYEGLVVQGQTFAPFEVFFAVAGLYWLMATAIAAGATWLEGRTGRVQAGAVRRSPVAARYLSLDWRDRAP